MHSHFNQPFHCLDDYHFFKEVSGFAADSANIYLSSCARKPKAIFTHYCHVSNQINMIRFNLDCHKKTSFCRGILTLGFFTDPEFNILQQVKHKVLGPNFMDTMHNLNGNLTHVTTTCMGSAN